MKTGLILVDIQNDYFPGGRMALSGVEEAGQNAGKLLSFFRENRWPTFHVQHIASGQKAAFFISGTRGAQIHEIVKPLPDDIVIRKHHVNSFRETRLLDELEKSGVGRVVIAGAMSHMCVDAATRAAFDLGFDCTVIHDACATRDLQFQGKTVPARQVHAAFMAALGMAYADVISLNEFLSGSGKSDTE